MERMRGNGIALPYHLGGKFLVQATAIYPLQPSSYPRLQPAKSVKITPLYPVHPATALEQVNSNNGAGSAKEQKKELKQTKAVTTSRQKKPARRVVVRKNTKQAK